MDPRWHMFLRNVRRRTSWPNLQSPCVVLRLRFVPAREPYRSFHLACQVIRTLGNRSGSGPYSRAEPMRMPAIPNSVVQHLPRSRLFLAINLLTGQSRKFRGGLGTLLFHAVNRDNDLPIGRDYSN